MLNEGGWLTSILALTSMLDEGGWLTSILALTSMLDEGGWLASRAGRFTRYPVHRTLGGP